MKTITLIIAFSMILSNADSQSIYADVLGTTGQNDTIGKFQVSWTVGECVIEQYCNTNCMVSQGFHQSYYKILRIDEKHEPSMDIRIYPNPAVDRVNIDLSKVPGNNSCRIELYGLKGELLHREETSRADIIILNLTNFRDEIMILKVIHLSASMEASFKIVKVNH